MRKITKVIATSLLSCVVLGGVGTATYAGFMATEQVDLTIGSKRVVYLDIANYSSWQAGSPKFAIYIWGSASNAACFANNAFMEPITSTLYRTTIPLGYSNCLFVKCNSSATYPSFDYDGGKALDQTADQTLPNDRHCFYVENNGTGEKGRGGAWGATNNHGDYIYSYTPTP